MNNYKYTLSKISIPSSFDLSSNSLYPIYNTLMLYICNTCMREEHEELVEGCDGDSLSFTTGITKEFEQMSLHDKVNELLSTPCGAEFILREEE